MYAPSFDMPYHTQITHINQFLGVMNMKCIQFFVKIQPHSHSFTPHTHIPREWSRVEKKKGERDDPQTG